jgi:hypothetical protein
MGSGTIRRAGISFACIGSAVALCIILVARTWDRPPRPDSHKVRIETPDRGYLLFPVSILEKETQEALEFDPSRGKPATISYRLTRDGHIRIRVLWKENKDLVLRTLLDWTHQEFGRHKIEWDGRDAAGNRVDNTKCFIDIQGDSPEHQKHESMKCHDMQLKVVPSGPPENEFEGLSGIRFELVGEPASGGGEGFRLRIYADCRLVSSQTLDPGTKKFALPPLKDLGPGKHFITVNVDDGQDHVGVGSIWVHG